MARRRLYDVRHLRTGAVAALLLVWCAAPAVACLAPQTLTPEESACCQRMAGSCHQSAAKHSCCKQVQPQDTASIARELSLMALDAAPALPVAAPELRTTSIQRA